jgi:prepilin-type N-terminal cleavage/methylation domain-containing protein/prepilin-type processing-associated H-X9-DG protein
MRNDSACRARERGFTLIELLLVVGIIAVLISLLLPAVQSARENARRVQCSKNLMQIGVALANYASTHKVFPPGVVNDKGPISNVPVGYHFGWAVQILPYLEQAPVYREFDFSQSVYAPRNDTARGHRIASFLCPSDGWTNRSRVTSYAACHHDVEAPIAADNHGVFFLNSRTSYDDISDGPACTILAGEFLTGGPGLGWAVGTMSSLRNTGAPINYDDPITGKTAPARTPVSHVTELSEFSSLIKDGLLPPGYVGGFSSHHPGGANFLFGDGSVRFLSQKIRTSVYRSLGNRADGNLISDDDY